VTRQFIFGVHSSRDFRDSTVGRRSRAAGCSPNESRRFNQTDNPSDPSTFRRDPRFFHFRLSIRHDPTPVRYSYLAFLAEGSRAQRGDDSSSLVAPPLIHRLDGNWRRGEAQREESSQLLAGEIILRELALAPKVTDNAPRA